MANIDAAYEALCADYALAVWAELTKSGKTGRAKDGI